MQSFKKEERLCSKKNIDLLYKSGSSFFLYPFKVQYLVDSSSLLSFSPAQVLFVVPKRRLKKAVDRNLAKRRMREAYRIHKAALLYANLETLAGQVLISFQYVGNDISSFEVIEKSLTKLLKDVAKKVACELA